MKACGTRGFTLVEIMVVVVILGILAVLIVPRVLGRSDEARAAAAKHDIATIMQSLKLYRLDNGRYPSNEQGLQALVTKPQSSPLPPGCPSAPSEKTSISPCTPGLRYW